MAEFAAISILALTVGLSLGRPRIGRLQIHHAQAAVIGAVVALALGVVPSDLLFVAAKLLARPVVTIVSLMVITLIAESAGLFEIIAGALARGARGSGPRLFGSLFLAGTLVGTFFTNDAAVLIFTPLVFHLIERIGGSEWTLENKIPFYFAVLYVGNLVGALVIANPINIVVSSIFGIGFIEYALWMALPAAVSIVVSFAGLWLFFGSQVPRRFSLPDSVPVTVSRRRLQTICAAVVMITLAGFFSQGFTGVPTWAVAACGAAALLVVHVTVGRGDAGAVVRGVGWDVIVFLCGMFVLAMGLRNAGLAEVVGDSIRQLAGGDLARMRLSTGVVASVCSAVINNHPTAGMMAWTIQDFGLPGLQTKLLAFAALIGGDLGPRMLPIGSLAALMWFRILRDRGVRIPYRLYVRIGVPVTLVAVVASILALNLEAWIYGLVSP